MSEGLKLKRRLAIMRLADRLLARAAIIAAPVSTDLIHAEHPEIRILPADLGPVASSLKISSKADGSAELALITFNSRQGIPRQRFSIAHEYGHYLLHHRRVLDEIAPAPASARAREQEADLFASCLLVPLWLLDADCPVFAYDEASRAPLDKLTLKLASRFNVSRACMGKALFALYHLRKALNAGG
jgi:Zn-dependent peptidase ImmA (M78 family)